MRLGAFFNPTGHHVASWRHAESQADAGINIAHYRELAQTAERAKFDMVFLADNVCVRKAHIDALSRSAQYIANFEPITLLSALSGATEPYRPRRDGDHELQRALSCGAQIRLARSHQRRPRRLESGDVRPAGGSAEFRPRRALRTWRALRARPRIRADRHRAVGQLGRRRLHPRQGKRAVLQSAGPAHARPQGQVLHGARPAQRAALAARPAGHRAGRRLRRHDQCRRRVRRGDLLRAADGRRRPEALSRISRKR